MNPTKKELEILKFYAKMTHEEDRYVWLHEDERASWLNIKNHLEFKRYRP